MGTGSNFKITEQHIRDAGYVDYGKDSVEVKAIYEFYTLWLGVSYASYVVDYGTILGKGSVFLVIFKNDITVFDITGNRVTLIASSYLGVEGDAVA